MITSAWVAKWRAPGLLPHSGASQLCRPCVPGRLKWPVIRYSSFSR